MYQRLFGQLPNLKPGNETGAELNKFLKGLGFRVFVSNGKSAKPEAQIRRRDASATEPLTLKH